MRIRVNLKDKNYITKEELEQHTKNSPSYTGYVEQYHQQIMDPSFKPTLFQWSFREALYQFPSYIDELHTKF